VSNLDNTGLGALIWETSRVDEGTISATGASIIAKAILSSDWLAAHDAEVRADERERVARQVKALCFGDHLGPEDAAACEYAYAAEVIREQQP